MMVPDTYWCIETAGVRVLVSLETIVKLEEAINERQGIFPYTDIFGSSGGIIVKQVVQYYSSDPEARRKAQEHDFAWDQENKANKAAWLRENNIFDPEA